MPARAPSERTRLVRVSNRGHYDRETIHSILDEALVAQVAFLDGDHPVVMPTAFGRDGDRLLLHGARRGRFLTAASRGEICVNVTLLDALVLARSWFHHSVNYRSVVAFGHAEMIEDPADKLEALRIITDHVAPGRSAASRQPTDDELTATAVLALPLDEASAKIRSGDPIDDDDDHALPHWAGCVPIELRAGAAVPAADLRAGIEPGLDATRYGPERSLAQARKLR